MTQQMNEPTSAASIKIRSFAEISDAVTYGLEHGGLLLSESNLGPEFFRLRSGIAGELMQKFVNCGIPLAIVVVNAEDHGERFCELAREHRRHPVVRFFSLESEAREWLNAATS